MPKLKRCACSWHETRTVGVKNGICQNCGGQTEMPDRVSETEMEKVRGRVLAADAAEVNAWPEWRKHPTPVARDQRRPPTGGKD